MPRLVMRDVADHVWQGDTPDPGQLGHPLPGVPMRSSPAGHLEFQSHCAVPGYVTPHGYERIAEVSWISTGDTASYSPESGWVLHGRASEVFKRHGEKISIERLRSTIEVTCDQSFELMRSKDWTGEVRLQPSLEGAADRHTARRILMAIRDQHPRV